MNKSTKNLTIIPIILSGGVGTRLWPLSRTHFPKQYLKIYENDKYSLLQKTVKRLDDLSISDDPIIICNEEQRFIVAEQMRQIGEPKILLEPLGRNTAPAIALAALKAHEQGMILSFLYSPPIMKLKITKSFRGNKNWDSSSFKWKTSYFWCET